MNILEDIYLKDSDRYIRITIQLEDGSITVEDFGAFIELSIRDMKTFTSTVAELNKIYKTGILWSTKDKK